MSGANVKAIDALQTLRTALLGFQSDALSSLESMRNSCLRTLEWLQTRQLYWQRECERCTRDLLQAQKALNECEYANSQARGKEGGRGRDCSGLQDAVRRARKALQEAEQELLTVQHFLKAVREAFERFQREGYHFSSMLNTELVQGASLLARTSTILTSYAGGGSSSFSGGTIDASSPLPSGLSAVQVHANGSFSITDWSDYPSSLPRPQGPFRLLPQHEYNVARLLGNKGSRVYSAAHPFASQGKDVHHIHPIKFGGDPTNPVNLFLLTKKEHQLYTVWWSRILAQIKATGGII